MTDKQTELERQIAHLAVEVSRLRRLIMIGFIVMGVLLAVSFIDRDLVMIVATFGFVLWGIAYVGMTLASALMRRSVRKRGYDVA